MTPLFRYEDIVANATEATKKLYKQLNIPFTDQVNILRGISKYIRTLNSNLRKVQSPCIFFHKYFYLVFLMLQIKIKKGKSLSNTKLKCTNRGGHFKAQIDVIIQPICTLNFQIPLVFFIFKPKVSIQSPEKFHL